LYLDKTLLFTYVPGQSALTLPADTALEIPAGSELVWTMHYTPYGVETTDRSRLAVKFWRGAPPKYLRKAVYVRKQGFTIPPRAVDYVIENEWKPDPDAEVVSVFPHMHLRGKSFLCEAVYPDGRREALLSVPHWDFNWQLNYVFDRPRCFPPGTILRLVGHYDNSRDNPNNPAPDRPVYDGEQTDAEMHVAFFDVRSARDRPWKKADPREPGSEIRK
jgi:hypothetical protein